MRRFPDHNHSKFIDPKHRAHCPTSDMEFVSLESNLPLHSFQTSTVISCRSRNEVNAIIYAACIPTVMPIFTRSYQKLSSWAVSKARDHKINSDDDVIRLSSNGNTTPGPKRIPSRSPLGSGRIESDGHSGMTQMLELDFMEHPGEV